MPPKIAVASIKIVGASGFVVDTNLFSTPPRIGVDDIFSFTSAGKSISIPRITSYNVCYTKLLRDIIFLQIERPRPVPPYFLEIDEST